MAAPQNTGMEKTAMHKLLVEAKKEPVNCAIGLGKDQSMGLLVMHKLKMGKMLEKQMIDEIPDAKNTRWGTVKVDEKLPKQADFYLNRPISGMARRLVKTLKGTGFSKVRIMLEDGTEVEGAADEEEDAAAAQAAPAAGAPTESPQPAAAAAPPPPPPPPPPAAEAPAQDAGELSRRLAALAPRIPQVTAGDDARRAELLKLATQVNVNIKTNNLVYAATYLAQLEKAIGAPPPPAPPPPPAAAAAPAQDAAALSRQLAALIPRVAALTDPAAKAALGKLATEANVNIKTNNLVYAAASIAQLTRGLEAGAAPAAPAAPPDLEALGNFLRRLILKIPGAAGDDDALRVQWMAMADAAGAALAAGDAVRGPAGVEALRVAMAGALQKMQQTAKDAGAFEKSGREWLAARQTVEDQMEELRATIMAAYEGQPVAAAIDKSFRDRTSPVLRTLDASLAVKLAAANKADAAGRQKLVEEAEGILDGYRSFAASPLLADLDDNPFVPLSIRNTLEKTLGNLAGALA